MLYSLSVVFLFYLFCRTMKQKNLAPEEKMKLSELDKNMIKRKAQLYEIEQSLPQQNSLYLKVWFTFNIYFLNFLFQFTREKRMRKTAKFSHFPMENWKWKNNGSNKLHSFIYFFYSLNSLSYYFSFSFRLIFTVCPGDICLELAIF